MKKILALTALIVSLNSCSQTSVNPTDPNENNSLTVRFLQTCKYYDSPLYIVNNQNVIYEDCNTRKYLNADIKSFRFPKFGHEGFAIDKNGIYFRGNFVQTDTTGFMVIGTGNEIYWKTKNKVFKDTSEVNNIDAQSFTAVGCSNVYFKDKDFIYYKGNKIEGSDGATASSESYDNYCYDKNNVYLEGKILSINGDRLIPVNSTLTKTSKGVFLRDGKKAGKIIDPQTLRRLSNSYSIDKNHLYYGATPTGIKKNELKNVKVWEHSTSKYFTDGKIIYSVDGVIVPNFDAKSFGIIPFSDFVYDKNGIYERFYDDNTNTSGFKKFPFKYSTPVSDKNTFKGQYSARYIIYENQAYDSWDHELFTNLTEQQITFAKQRKKRLYKTSAGITERYDYDYLLYKADNTIWWKDIKTSADAATFATLGRFYKDKDNFYQYDREKGLIKINGIDIASAKPFNNFIMDKNYIYWETTRVIKSDDAQLLGVFAGYRQGCGLDTQPASDYYLLKNIDGYWLAEISATVSIRNLGSTLPPDWHKGITNFELQ